ncbi:fibroblast growth factor 1-like [Orbicella faveolata]|uniref:fibroblast growth factor 1-like n=1 Tax=Orbicella faveolata TaxID=48498 RepID=UPI0009E4388C|nr:fibroblast growth factor 1-like [Orbicella faveolata]
MSSLFLMLFVTILCVTLFPSNVLARGLRSERNSNTTRSSADRSSHKFQTIQPRKQAPRNRRPEVHVKERGPIKLTKFPTNSKRVRLFGRVGLFLHCNVNGTVSGSLNQLSMFVKFELQSFGPSIVRIRSIETGNFLAIDSKGVLQTKKNATDECLFYQNHEENLFVSFASFKYYMNEHYDMFISIKKNGEVKQATSTLPGQDAIQFIALNADNWRFARLDGILG